MYSFSYLVSVYWSMSSSSVEENQLGGLRGNDQRGMRKNQANRVSQSKKGQELESGIMAADIVT